MLIMILAAMCRRCFRPRFRAREQDRRFAKKFAVMICPGFSDLGRAKTGLKAFF